MRNRKMSNRTAFFLDGYICKQPVYRMTPLGREIADLLLAVNRPYGKSDYLPCICWGRNARFAGNLRLGPISISGDGFRAGLTRNGLKEIRWNVGQPMRFR